MYLGNGKILKQHHTPTALMGLGLIFIENIGNLICPAEFPLGSKKRVVVISVTEGPYMVKKHLHMFLGAAIVVINKSDLAEVMGVSGREWEQLRFCYGAITRETVIEESVLELEPSSAVVSCHSCSYLGPPKYWEDDVARASTPTLQCPHCGKTTQAIQGHECSIRKIRYVA